MQNDGSNLKRRMVPRWRSLAQTPAHELRSTGNGEKNAAIAPALTAAFKRWQTSQSMVQAAELLDIAVVASDKTIAIEAARSILAKPDATRSSIVEAANLYLKGREAESFQPTFEEKIPAPPTRDKIHRAKLRMVESPRDGLTATELSRLYALAGQRRKAKEWMRRALKLAPENRYVLRSATRLFTHLDSPDEAMEAIWRSDAVRHDPWIQAAEVAVADQLEKTPKWAGKARKSVSDGAVGISRSELAMGLAALELKSGAKLRAVKKLANASLSNPTESTVAQALWLRESGAVSLDVSPHYAMAMANEAAALRAREAGDHREAIRQAEAWSVDQPFSPRPFMLASTAANVFLNMPDIAEVHCQRGLLYHPDNPSLLNGLIVSMARQGRLEPAEELLPKLHSTIAHDLEMEAYYHAACGLIQFQKRNFEQGRSEYLQSIHSARQNGLNWLAVNAMLYWIEQEALSNSFSLYQWDGIKSAIDSNIAKLTGMNKISVERAWNARSQFVAEALLRHQAQQQEAGIQREFKASAKFKLDSGTFERITN